MRRYPAPKTGPHTGWSPTRDRTAQQRFRQALIERAGGQCEYVAYRITSDGINQERCPNRAGLQAHHDRPGYTPDCGRLLCQTHHRLEDRHAR